MWGSDSVVDAVYDSVNSICPGGLLVRSVDVFFQPGEVNCLISGFNVQKAYATLILWFCQVSEAHTWGSFLPIPQEVLCDGM